MSLFSPQRANALCRFRYVAMTQKYVMEQSLFQQYLRTFTDGVSMKHVIPNEDVHPVGDIIEYQQIHGNLLLLLLIQYSSIRKCSKWCLYGNGTEKGTSSKSFQVQK